MPRHTHPRRRRGAFTTIELLVVIGIIVLLIGLLIPVVGRIRESATATNTAAWIQQLSSAIQAYQSDFRAYPGPLSNDQIRRTPFNDVTFATGVAGFATADGTNGANKITMSENLVLALCGGLRPDPLNPGRSIYDPSLVGNGAMSLNPGAPKRFQPYVEPIHLSWRDVGGSRTGAFVDDASQPNGADDSIIPEFVDRYTDPMPILYFRAKVAANPTGTLAPNNNPVITNDLNFAAGRLGQYDLSQNIAYLQPANASEGTIGVGKRPGKFYTNGSEVDVPTPIPHGLRTVELNSVMSPTSHSGYDYPYNAFAYFRDPALSSPTVTGTGYAAPHVARQKDRFILISAGPDRIYGTSDDITSFGPVIP